MSRAVRVRVEGDKVGPKLQLNMKRQGDRIKRSIQEAAADVQQDILTRGRRDISRAGRFGTRWIQGLFADITQGGGNTVIGIGHRVPYWTVFQKGKVIRGKPLLWIPLSFSDAVGIRARDYPGGLFRVDRKRGKPLLLSIKDKKPKYFGARSVRIPKKFHIFEIAREAARKLQGFYNARFARNRSMK